jgi:preprotein translocase subunit SecF
MELIRKIAFVVETAEEGIDSEDIHIEGYSNAQIAYHCELMNESQLIDAIDTQTLSSEYATFQINRLTSKGHDFVDAARSDTIWNKAKATITATVGGVSIDVFIRFLKAQALSALGLPPES